MHLSPIWRDWFCLANWLAVGFMSVEVLKQDGLTLLFVLAFKLCFIIWSWNVDPEKYGKWVWLYAYFITKIGQVKERRSFKLINVSVIKNFCDKLHREFKVVTLHLLRNRKKISVKEIRIYKNEFDLLEDNT